MPKGVVRDHGGHSVALTWSMSGALVGLVPGARLAAAGATMTSDARRDLLPRRLSRIRARLSELGGDPPRPTTGKAGAEALFEQALDRGKTAEACALFGQSGRLDPATGSLMNLGNCERMLGHKREACTAWAEAARLAQSQGSVDRLKLIQAGRAKEQCPT